uniref:Secreted protein n=1 Tax=Stegastes partitus TaxID=144197 RepID=A0A3B5BE30_9TELE
MLISTVVVLVSLNLPVQLFNNHQLCLFCPTWTNSHIQSKVLVDRQRVGLEAVGSGIRIHCPVQRDSHPEAGAWTVVVQVHHLHTNPQAVHISTFSVQDAKGHLAQVRTPAQLFPVQVALGGDDPFPSGNRERKGLSLLHHLEILQQAAFIPLSEVVHQPADLGSRWLLLPDAVLDSY